MWRRFPGAMFFVAAWWLTFPYGSAPGDSLSLHDTSYLREWLFWVILGSILLECLIINLGYSFRTDSMKILDLPFCPVTSHPYLDSSSFYLHFLTIGSSMEKVLGRLWSCFYHFQRGRWKCYHLTVFLCYYALIYPNSTQL